METFYGIVFVVIVAGITMRLANNYKEIALAIAIAFVFRISAALINLYVVTLPDGGIDATGFEINSWMWGKDGLIVAFSHFFERGTSWFYSHIGSLIYAIFGRNPLILQSISVLAGVYCVVLVWKLSIEVWGSHGVAKISAWLVAIYPILILYSSLTLREVFITMLLLYSMFHVILWFKTNKVQNAFIALTTLCMQILFHPGVATAGILFSGILFLYYNKIFLTSLITNARLDMQSFVIVLSCLFFGVYIYIYGTSLSFPYYSWLQFDNLIWRVSVMFSGDAVYPSWLIPENPMQFILLLVPKFFYFLFAPLPWDITKFKHVIGMLDGVVYLFLCVSIYSHRKYIKSNPQALLILVFAIFLILVFSIAVGNFGTGLRHRSKLLPIIIVLAAPFIYKVFFSRKKN